MTDIVLIHPGATHGIFGPLGDTLVAIEPPTWARMIAGWLRDRGKIVQIIDQEAERLSATDIAVRVFNAAPKLVAIVVSGHQPSASTQQMVGARAVAQELRNLAPAIPTIMVGNHPSALPARTLREEPVTYVCDGEGPLTLLGLLEGEELNKIPGLVRRDPRNGPACDDVIANPVAPLIPIDELHGDVWDILPMGAYKSHNWQRLDDLSKRQPYASIYTTLGCPFKCSFCMINVFQHTNRYRRRDPIKVVDQIEKLYREYGVTTLKIADELFVLTEAHYVTICEELIRRGIGEKLNFWCYARVDTVKEDRLALLYAAGCRWLALGIESGSAVVRDASVKNMRNNDIVGVVRSIQAAGISVIGNYIFGLPQDSPETMQATLDLALECCTEWGNFYCAQAYPGSKLYDEALASGAVLPEGWAGYSQHNEWTRPLDTQHVSAKEVLAFRDQAFITYFSDRVYQAKVWYKFGEATLQHVKDMLEYKLKRKLLTGEIQ